VTGNGGELLDDSTWKALDHILELFPDLRSLEITTAHGSCHVARDFPSDYTQQVDRILAEVFKNNPAVAGVTFRWSEKSKQHTATPDDPHWSAEGKDYARIEAAMARGEMTTEEGIDAYLQIARRAAASDDAPT
jgi:hypothetical protein